MLKKIFLALAMCAAACGGSESADDAVTGDEANVTSEATVTFTSDYQMKVVGTPKAGGTLVVDYALDRLPQCRGNVGGGGPAWNIGGYYSLNGGEPKLFEVTALNADNTDRVTKPARIKLDQGGDLALWFEVSSGFGCHEYDSAFGNNYHVDVTGTVPEAGASITFGKDGEPTVEGTLKAGDTVKIRYEQDRLPECRRVQNGAPLWNISGYAQVAGGETKVFGTGRPEGADREEIDAIVELPRKGELALWFDVVSVGGCHEVDSNGGKNYTFAVE